MEAGSPIECRIAPSVLDTDDPAVRTREHYAGLYQLIDPFVGYSLASDIPVHDWVDPMLRMVGFSSGLELPAVLLVDGITAAVLPYFTQKS